MANAPPERLEDEMFRLFEDLREKRLRRAAVGLVMDLLNHVIVNEQRKPTGVIPKTAESREGTIAACRRAIRSILSFLLLRAEDKPERKLDETVRTQVGARQMEAEATEATELLDDIGCECALYIDRRKACGLSEAELPILVHVMRNAVGNDDILRRHIEF
ncbi:MAG TPA: hypothetical protein VFG04_02750 [Planctomycetaceae bacterium]|jgi:hypothetical protein|nr:hypothetical protein [Planctomycetaceae bacterium]